MVEVHRSSLFEIWILIRFLTRILLTQKFFKKSEFQQNFVLKTQKTIPRIVFFLNKLSWGNSGNLVQYIIGDLFTKKFRNFIFYLKWQTIIRIFRINIFLSFFLPLNFSKKIYFVFFSDFFYFYKINKKIYRQKIGDLKSNLRCRSFHSLSKPKSESFSPDGKIIAKSLFIPFFLKIQFSHPFCDK